MVFKESEHYVFHFEEHTLIEKDLNEIISTQENCFSHICSVLKGNMNEKIHYYLCSTPEEVGRIYGDNEPCNGFAKAPNTIYAVYNERIKCIGFHEDAHLISYAICGRPQSSFMREGLAMYFDYSWLGIDCLSWTKYYMKQNKVPPLKSLYTNDVFFQYSDLLTYPIAGCLTRYLIERFGLDAYLEFYKTESFSSFHLDIEQIEMDFYQYLNLVSIDDFVFHMIEKKI